MHHRGTPRRLEPSLLDDGYSCEAFCSDLPYTFWNTCPLCLCGLLPVFIVCVSAVFRLDYATHVTDIGAQIINEIGLSYTVYYTAGCWPPPGEGGPLSAGLGGRLRPSTQNPRCNTEHFEIAAGEFDALSGSLLKVQNVTKLHARTLESVKVTPDWRYIVFIGALANDIGNLYAVGAEQREATQAIPLLTEKQLDELDDRCQHHSADVLLAAGVDPAEQRVGPGGGLARPPLARIAGFKHLHVIIPGIPPIQNIDDLESATMPQPTPSTSLPYRAAFAFECAEAAAMSSVGGPASGRPLRFSQLAVLDFQLMGLNTTNPLNPNRWGAYSEAELHIIDAEPAAPVGATEAVQTAVSHLKSQACPRFVPSKMGHELLFVAEDPMPVHPPPPSVPDAWLPPEETPPSRWMALTSVPRSAREPQTWVPAQSQAQTSGGAGDVSRARRLQEHSKGGGDETEDLPMPPARVPGQRVPAGTPPPLSEAPPTPAPRPTPAPTTTAAPTTLPASPPPPTTTRTTPVTTTTTVATTSTQATTAATLAPTTTTTVTRSRGSAILLDVGEGALPRAPIRGCPEFVPGVYVTTEKKEGIFSKGKGKAKGDEKLAKATEESTRKFRDTFVILSDPASSSVLGVDGQVLTVSLPEGPSTGRVDRVQLLYNVDTAPPPEDLVAARHAAREAAREAARVAEGAGRGGQAPPPTVPPPPLPPLPPLPPPRLRLGGCQPIRAAGAQGHMRLAWISQLMMSTFHLSSSGKDRYSTWLACLTADQRIAIVSSGNTDHWINMSVPYPMWTGRSLQDMWCPPEREEACFEVWSDPNPHE